MAFTSPTNKFRTSIVEIVATVLLIALVFWFFIKPKMTQLSEVRAQVSAQEAVLNHVQSDSAQLTDLISKLQQSKDDIALVDEALPLDSRVTRVHVLLDSLVKASGAKLGSLNIQPGTNLAAGNKSGINNKFGVTRKIQTFYGDLTVIGTVESFKNLLQLIETNGRIIDVSNMELSSAGGISSFKLRLKAYSYDQ